MIDEKEAEVVRLVFRMSKESASLSQIAQILQKQSIPSLRGKTVWNSEFLWKILNNEKYLGKVILQKTFLENFLKHKQIKNIGQHDKYEIIGNYEPIIIE